MDDDKDDKALVEKTMEAVKDMASSVTDAAKSAVAPSEDEKMTVMDVPLVGDAAAKPMPLIAPKKRKAPVKRAPAKTPPKKATVKEAAKKTSKKSAAKKSNKAAKRSPAKNKSSAERKAVGKKKTAKKVAKKKKAKRG
jgi:hypothetical protein